MPSRLEVGEYLAEFFLNSKIDPPIYHYIITRVGSREIEVWGSSYDREECNRDALKAINDLQQHKTFRAVGGQEAS
jgi:hypothetical protein